MHLTLRSVLPIMIAMETFRQADPLSDGKLLAQPFRCLFEMLIVDSAEKPLA